MINSGRGHDGTGKSKEETKSDTVMWSDGAMSSVQENGH